MKLTQFLLISFLFVYSGYTSSTTVSKDALSRSSDFETSDQVSQSALEAKIPVPSDPIQVSKESLIAIIMEQKKHIEQLESSQTNKFEENRNLPSSTEFNYSAWVSILLASIGVLVTVVGVMIALISFVGYKNFKESTKEAAEKISEDTASAIAREEVKNKINEIAKLELARLIDSGDLKEHLESAVDVIFRKNNTSQGMSGFNKYPEIDEEEGA
ncbi:hypothetical protein [Vibrio furnissii]|uniref:hypothetical protein n=1 Tax=Vibrio furnissii TaxID=29494 RepID=UPI00257238C6|nr:hypothetical protein [Vibrio furnissii]WJG21997.1 hypothetical protein QSU95_02155 [Vibrio furnissii]